MKHQIKAYLKITFKPLLNALLIVQLSFMPCYGYSSIGNGNSNGTRNENENTQNDIIQSLLHDLKTTNHSITDPTILAHTETLIDLATAIETGQAKEYLEQNPQVRQETDYFMLSDQKAELLETHFDSQTNRWVETSAEVIQLNDYNSMPYLPNFKDLKVHYHKETKILSLEGSTKNRVLVRQTIPDLDIIDYVNDGEFLLILDHRKGLLLADMVFAKAYLGLAPLPIQHLPFSLFEKSSEERTDISLELIDRSAKPINSDLVPKNFKKESLWTGGDFRISYRESRSDNYYIERILTREELRSANKLHFEIVDVMLQSVAPSLLLQTEEGVKAFQQELEDLKKESEKPLLGYLLSSLFNKNNLHKLNLAREGMVKRVQQMEVPLSERDTFTFNEWNSSFQKISQSQALLLAEENMDNTPTEKINKWRKKYQSDPHSLSLEKLIALKKDVLKKYQAHPASLSTEDWSILLFEKNEFLDKNQKQTRGTALKILASIMNHKITTSVGIVLPFGYFVVPETYILIANKYLSVFNNLLYSLHGSAYSNNLWPHLIVMSALPVFLLGLAWAFIPVLKGLRGFLRWHLPSARGMIDSLTETIENWDKEGPMTRTMGAGMKIIAYAIYPAWHYLSKIVGQPNFFPAIQKELNPFKVIDPKSDIGEMAGLNQPTRLGTNQPYWRQNGTFKKQRQLQNIAQEKSHRQESLAFVMALLAVAEKELINPEQIIIYGVSRVNLEDIKEVLQDPYLRMEMLWVKKNLLREIQNLDEMDMRKELSEMDPKILIRYYEKTRKWAKEAKAHPNFLKKTRSFFNEGWMGQKRQLFSLPNIVSWNQAEHDMLKKTPTAFVQGRVSINFYSDQGWVTLMPPLTTERAEFGMENLFQPAVNDSHFAHSSRQHSFEVFMNAVGWLFIAGPQTSLVFTNRTKIIDEISSALSSKYQSLEDHTYRLFPQVQKEGTYYFKQFLYLLSGGNPDNLGAVMFRHFSNMFRFWQFSIFLALSLRVWYQGQSLLQAILGFLLIQFATHWVFGWPWDVINGGDRTNQTDLIQNKQRLEALIVKLSKIQRGLYPDLKEIRQEYQSAVEEVMALYDSQDKRKLLKNHLNSIDPKWQDFFEWQTTLQNPALSKKKKEQLEQEIRDFFAKESVDSMQETSKSVLKLIIEKPPLPIEVNKTANIMTTNVLGGVLTTYLAVLLYFWAFDPDKLNWTFVGSWVAGSVSLYYFFRRLYKKDMKPLREFFENLPKRSRNPWNNYYSRVLDLGKTAKRSCQRVFSKTKK